MILGLWNDKCESSKNVLRDEVVRGDLRVISGLAMAQMVGWVEIDDKNFLACGRVDNRAIVDGYEDLNEFFLGNGLDVLYVGLDRRSSGDFVDEASGSHEIIRIEFSRVSKNEGSLGGATENELLVSSEDKLNSPVWLKLLLSFHKLIFTFQFLSYRQVDCGVFSFHAFSAALCQLWLALCA